MEGSSPAKLYAGVVGAAAHRDGHRRLLLHLRLQLGRGRPRRSLRPVRRQRLEQHAAPADRPDRPGGVHGGGLRRAHLRAGARHLLSRRWRSGASIIGSGDSILSILPVNTAGVILHLALGLLGLAATQMWRRDGDRGGGRAVRRADSRRRDRRPRRSDADRPRPRAVRLQRLQQLPHAGRVRQPRHDRPEPRPDQARPQPRAERDQDRRRRLGLDAQGPGDAARPPRRSPTTSRPPAVDALPAAPAERRRPAAHRPANRSSPRTAAAATRSPTPARAARRAEPRPDQAQQGAGARHDQGRHGRDAAERRHAARTRRKSPTTCRRSPASSSPPLSAFGYAGPTAWRPTPSGAAVSSRQTRLRLP